MRLFFSENFRSSVPEKAKFIGDNFKLSLTKHLELALLFSQENEEEVFHH